MFHILGFYPWICAGTLSTAYLTICTTVDVLYATHFRKVNKLDCVILCDNLHIMCLCVCLCLCLFIVHSYMVYGHRVKPIHLYMNFVEFWPTVMQRFVVDLDRILIIYELHRACDL